MSKIFDMEGVMAFREKSAWVMAALVLLVGGWYVQTVVSASLELGRVLEPTGAFIRFTAYMIAGSIAVQVILASLSPRDANRAADERERPALSRASSWAGVVLAIGAVGGLLNYTVRQDGALLFHIVLISLIASQLAEYVFQIVLLRRS